MIVCQVIPQSLSQVSQLARKKKKRICARMWLILILFHFCVLEEKLWMTKWRSDMLSGKPRGWKGEICPITPTLTPDQTASEGGVLDEMRGCGKWLMLQSVPLLPTSICLLLLRLLFCYHTQTHINTLSLSVCQPVSLCNLEQLHQTFISSLVLLTQSFQNQWGGLG